MLHKRMTLVVVLLLVAALAVFAGGTQEAGKPVIRFATNWLGGVGFEKTTWEKDIYAYAEAHKDEVTFKWEIESGDDLRTKIKTDMAANNVPDLFSYWTRGAIRAMVDNDLLMEVHDYLALSKNIKWEDFPLDGWKAYSFDGGKTAYGFPLEGSTAYFLANKTIFDKVGLKYPKTHQELMDTAKKLVNAGYVPVAVGSKGGNPAHFWFAAMYYQFGTDAYMEGVQMGPKNFDCPETIRAAELILEQLKAGVFPKDPLANGDFGPAVALYNERKAAMIYSFPWMINAFNDDVIAESVVIDIPQVPGAKTKPSTFVVGGTNYGLVVNKKSFADPAKQKHLVEFLDFYLSDKILMQVATSGRWVDKVMTIDPSMVSPLYVKTAEYQKGKSLLINLWTRMPDPTTQEVYSFACDELWAQSITAKEFVEKTQKSTDKFFKR